MKKILKYQNIVIASHNNGKVRELKNLFSKFSTKIIPVKKLGLPEPKETGKTFEENAKIKSSEATRLSNLPAIGRLIKFFKIYRKKRNIKQNLFAQLR